MSIVYPTSHRFVKNFSHHFYTEKPNSKKKPTENSKQYSNRILCGQYARFISQFQLFQPFDDRTEFKFNF